MAGLEKKFFNQLPQTILDKIVGTFSHVFFKVLKNVHSQELTCDIFYLTHYVFTVFKKYTKYRIMLKIVKYDLKKCIKNTIMIKYNKILRNKLFTKPRSLKLM